MLSTDTMSYDHPIRLLYEQILIAWNQQDAAAMAARFEEDGNIVGFDGSQVIRAQQSRTICVPSSPITPLRHTLQLCARFGCSVAMWGSFARLLG